MSRNRKKGMPPAAWLGILAVVAVVIYLFASGTVSFGGQPAAVGGDGTTGGVTTTGGFDCPDTLRTAVGIDVQNVGNTTGAEGFDMTTVCTSADGSDIKSFTDTTSPTTQNFKCGVQYTCRAVSGDAQSGDNTRIMSVISGAVTIVEDGRAFQFTPEGSDASYKVGAWQHGTLECRLRDRDSTNDLIYYQPDTLAGQNAYNVTGKTFYSTTSNATGITVGTAGTLSLTLECRAADNVDERFGDHGIWFLIDAITDNKWDSPSVVIDGVTYTDAKGSFTVDEAAAYTSENWAYKITDVNSLITRNDPIEIRLDFSAKAGINPAAADALNFTLASIGQYQSIENSNLVKLGSVTDAATPTDVYTEYESQIVPA